MVIKYIAQPRCLKVVFAKILYSKGFKLNSGAQSCKKLRAPEFYTSHLK